MGYASFWYVCAIQGCEVLLEMADNLKVAMRWTSYDVAPFPSVLATESFEDIRPCDLLHGTRPLQNQYVAALSILYCNCLLCRKGWWRGRSAVANVALEYWSLCVSLNQQIYPCCCGTAWGHLEGAPELLSFELEIVRYRENPGSRGQHRWPGL